MDTRCAAEAQRNAMEFRGTLAGYAGVVACLPAYQVRKWEAGSRAQCTGVGLGRALCFVERLAGRRGTADEALSLAGFPPWAWDGDCTPAADPPPGSSSGSSSDSETPPDDSALSPASTVADPTFRVVPPWRRRPLRTPSPVFQRGSPDSQNPSPVAPWRRFSSSRSRSGGSRRTSDTGASCRYRSDSGW